MTTITLLSGNKHKLKAAQHVFNKYGITLVGQKYTDPEIQADTSTQAAIYATETFTKREKIPSIREDHALYIDGVLGGKFPGPYTAYFDRMVDVVARRDMIFAQTTEDCVGGYLELGCSYTNEIGETTTSTHQVAVEFTKSIMPGHGNIDQIMRLKGTQKNFSEYGPDDDDFDMWGYNFHQIAKHITLK